VFDLPLTKNWVPLLSKNLDPTTEMVGSEAALTAFRARPASNEAAASALEKTMAGCYAACYRAARLLLFNINIIVVVLVCACVVKSGVVEILILAVERD
jgi:hypothetical protein